MPSKSTAYFIQLINADLIFGKSRKPIPLFFFGNKKPTEGNSRVGVVIYRHTRNVAADLVSDRGWRCGLVVRGFNNLLFKLFQYVNPYPVSF
jgi:hypothetical protein